MEQILLSDSDLSAARQALTGPDSRLLVDYMFAKALGQDTTAGSAAVRNLAVELGWVVSDGTDLTALGGLVADPLREYKFWLDRNRSLPWEGSDVPHMDAQSYAGKSVLEVGSSVGCNLFSLSRMPGEYVGVEPVTVYRQLTSILAEREGIPTPRIVHGSGEELPFEDEQFDIVLCYSAHQYMNVRRAFTEMARVLRRGGELQILGGCLGSFVAVSLAALAKRPALGGLKQFGLTIVNTIAYSVAGQRAIVPDSRWSTAAPIYPTKRTMERWIRESGLQLQTHSGARAGSETCFIAKRLS